MATVGRKTKYDPNYHPKQVLKYSLLGLTDVQMSGALEITESTLNLWKKKHPEFSESIKRGKFEADANVVSTLYKRALGHTQKNRKAFKVKHVDPGTGKLYDTIEFADEEIYFPPDITATIFWLKNRQSSTWRDKTETEHSGEIKGKTTIVFSKGAKGKD
ncbi:terminase [Chryseobacterium sp. SIMBA_028]|uniref:terminase n=1 Tax=Chryseobacterium sp. SIMBA_028 TaxID=3085771 RepID=UPI00397BF8E0